MMASSTALCALLFLAVANAAVIRRGAGAGGWSSLLFSLALHAWPCTVITHFALYAFAASCHLPLRPFLPFFTLCNIWYFWRQLPKFTALSLHPKPACTARPLLQSLGKVVFLSFFPLTCWFFFFIFFSQFGTPLASTRALQDARFIFTPL